MKTNETIENAPALELHRLITRLTRRKSKLSTEIHQKQLELEQICIHNEKEKIEKYVEGGYLNKEEYHTIIKCKLCGKELDHKMVYGSFC